MFELLLARKNGTELDEAFFNGRKRAAENLKDYQ